MSALSQIPAQKSNEPPAELALLGALFANSATLKPALAQGLHADWFTTELNQQIFRAMTAMNRDGIAIDLVTLDSWLRKNTGADVPFVLEHVGRCDDQCTSPSHWP